MAVVESLERRQLLSAASVAIATEYAHTASETDSGGKQVKLLLGKATSNILPYAGISGAFYQTYHDNGVIVYSAATGAHVVYGDIGFEFNVTGGEKDASGNNVKILIGLPTADEANVSGVSGGRVSKFQHGWIYWSQASGAHVVYGDIGTKYAAVKGPTVLGLPTGDEANTPDGSGRFQHFKSPTGTVVGAIDWTGNYGAHDVHGQVAAEFEKVGWEKIGEATTDEIDITNSSYHGEYNRFVLQTRLGLPGAYVYLPLKYAAVNWNNKNGASLSGGPSYTDVDQGASPTCWIVSSMAALVAKGDNLANLITYEGNNTYKVSLHDWNNQSIRPAGGTHPVTETVVFNGTTYAADANFKPADPSQSWLLILQRAILEVAKIPIQSPHSGGAGDAQVRLTGIAYDDTLLHEAPGSSAAQSLLEADLKAGDSAVFETLNTGTATLVADHDYAVLSANSKGVTLYNPWGTEELSADPGKKNPFTVSWSVIARDGSVFWADGF